MSDNTINNGSINRNTTDILLLLFPLKTTTITTTRCFISKQLDDTIITVTLNMYNKQCNCYSYPNQMNDQMTATLNNKDYHTKISETQRK